MQSLFLLGVDQLRVALGLLVALHLFCHHAVPQRDAFWLRAGAGLLGSVAAGLAYLPIRLSLSQFTYWVNILLSAGYWLALPVAVGACVYFCYEITLSNLLFRLLLARVCESVVTTVLRYLIVMTWLPTLPEEHTLLYVILLLALYAGMYAIWYHLLARPLQRGGARPEDSARTVWAYALAQLSFQLMMFSVDLIFEWFTGTMNDSAAFLWQISLIRYFCIGARSLACVLFLINQYYICQTYFLAHERDLIGQVLRQKSEQYAFARENAEFIRQKCHDLKRQLRALEFAGEGERRAVLEETRRAADFYDAIIETGNSALDTLLTEHAIQCARRGIRLSCVVDARGPYAISGVDLYTMLSNALDNALEGVERLEDPEKRTIRFVMQKRGKMLCVTVENYYEGTITLREGLPVTSKGDKREHGIGVRSIRTLAQRYGGEISIQTEDQIFSLQILLPAA